MKKKFRNKNVILDRAYPKAKHELVENIPRTNPNSTSHRVIKKEAGQLDHARGRSLGRQAPFERYPLRNRRNSDAVLNELAEIRRLKKKMFG